MSYAIYTHCKYEDGIYKSTHESVLLSEPTNDRQREAMLLLDAMEIPAWRGAGFIEGVGDKRTSHSIYGHEHRTYWLDKGWS